MASMVNSAVIANVVASPSSSLEILQWFHAVPSNIIQFSIALIIILLYRGYEFSCYAI